MDQDFNYHGSAMTEQRVAVDHVNAAGAGESMPSIAMPAAVPPVHSELKRFRLSKRESQEKFWGRFGVTQSSGSRFETGLGIPAPVAILVKLYVKGKLSDGDLPG